MTIIDMTQFFPWTFLLHLSRALIVFTVTHAMLKDKYNAFVSFLSIVGIGFLYSTVTITWVLPHITEYILLLFYLILFAVIIMFVYEGSIVAKLLSLVLSACTWMGGTALYFKLTENFFNSPAFRMSELELTLPDLVFESLFIYALSFVFVVLIKIFQKRTTEAKAQNRRSIIFFLFPITHIFCMYLSYSPYQLAALNDLELSGKVIDYSVYENLSIIFYVICMFADLSLIFIVDYLNKLEEKNLQNEKQILQSQMDYQQTQMLREEKTAFRKIKHDMANLLTTAEGFIEIGKPEKAQELLKSTNLTLAEVGGRTLCSNETINTTLFIKQQNAKDAGVDLQVDVRETLPVSMDDYDLCRLLHNILDNAIHAAAACPDAQTVELQIDIGDNQIQMHCKNTCPKSEKRTTRDGHGYGIGIIKEIVKAHNGTYTGSRDGQYYSTDVTVFE